MFSFIPSSGQQLSFKTGGIQKNGKRRPPTATAGSYLHYHKFLENVHSNPAFMGLSAQQKMNVLASLEHDFFAHMNHSRMNGIRSSHRQKKAMFEGIARNILAKYAKEEASDSDEDELSLSEKTDGISVTLGGESFNCVNLSASHRLPSKFQDVLVLTLGEISKSDDFCKEILGSRAYDPLLWEIESPHLSPSRLPE
jgi:hypothetical protein